MAEAETISGSHSSFDPVVSELTEQFVQVTMHETWRTQLADLCVLASVESRGGLTRNDFIHALENKITIIRKRLVDCALYSLL